MGIRIFVGVIVVAALAFGWWYFKDGEMPQTPITETPSSSGENIETYASTTQRLRFTYPDIYVLEEREAGTAQRRQHVITLIDRDDLPPPQGGEGPPSITMQIFQDLGQSTLRDWIEDVQDSNFKLSPDSKLTTTTVSGTEGLRYRWSGLYEGESVAVLRSGRIYVFSVAWLEANDRIRDDFEEVVESVMFSWE